MTASKYTTTQNKPDKATPNSADQSFRALLTLITNRPMKAEGLAATLWMRPWARHLLPLHPLSILSAYSLAVVQATGMGKR